MVLTLVLLVKQQVVVSKKGNSMTTDLKLKASVSYLEEALKDAMESGEVEDNMDQTGLNHYFTDPIEDFNDLCLYGRELSVPKGMVITGALHRHPHIITLIKGKMSVASEQGRKVITAPSTWAAPAGSKRAFYAIEDSVILNVHITTIKSEENLDEQEKEVTAPSYSSIGLEEPNYKLLGVDV